MKKIALLLAVVLCFSCVQVGEHTREFGEESHDASNASMPEAAHSYFKKEWEKSYGVFDQWSARYEGPQPVGDADNDGKNELLIGGRDPFLRIVKWDEEKQRYYEHAKIIDPVFGIGYGMWIQIMESWKRIPQPFGSATGFAIADIDNDGVNEIGVVWGRHFSAFKWNGVKYTLIGRYIISDVRDEWDSTLDCIVGDCDNDGMNEVVVTGGYNSGLAEVVILSWSGEQFIKESEWNGPDTWWVYYPWIADVDEDGLNEIIINSNKTVVLNWNGTTWTADIVAHYKSWIYPFGCVTKDSDGDGKPEIHVTFDSPSLRIYEYENGTYNEKASFFWETEKATIEAIDIGDVDNDGVAEICVGTDKVHILQWNGNAYEEEYLIEDTYGCLAVTCVGDFDNDGKLEIHAGAVLVDNGEDYRSWIFKYVD